MNRERNHIESSEIEVFYPEQKQFVPFMEAYPTRVPTAPDVA
jgi:hypothetical protein